MIRRFKRYLTETDYRLLLACALVVLLSGSHALFDLYRTQTTALAANGGSYNEGAVGQIHVLNPVFCPAGSLDQDLCSLLFSGLTRFDPETNEVWGDIAFRWDTSSDGLTYTFFLHDNVVWHDGQPLTADDVVYTYQTVLQSPSYSGALKDTFKGTNVVKIDDYTVQFVLTYENAFFPGFLTVGLLPAHLLKDVPVEDLEFISFNRRPIGSGMYQLDNWITASNYEQIELRSFDRFYRTKPHLKTITYFAFHTFDDLYARISSLDGVRQVTPGEIENFKKYDEFDLHTLVLHRAVTAFFNTARANLKNPTMRRGLQFAIPGETLASQIPNITLINAPVPTLSTGGNIYDIDKAKESLYAAGWKIFSDKYSDGIRRNDKQEKLTLSLVTTTDPSLLQTAEILKTAWLAVGVEVTITPVEIGKLETEYLRTRNYDILLLGQNLGSDIDLYSFWHSSQSESPGLNLSQYRSPEVDLLIEKIRATHDYKEQLAITQTLMQKLQADVPAVFLYTPAHVYATRRSFGHVIISNNIGHVYDRFALIEQWYSDFERIWK